MNHDLLQLRYRERITAPNVVIQENPATMKHIPQFAMHEYAISPQVDANHVLQSY